MDGDAAEAAIGGGGVPEVALRHRVATDPLRQAVQALLVRIGAIGFVVHAETAGARDVIVTGDDGWLSDAVDLKLLVLTARQSDRLRITARGTEKDRHRRFDRLANGVAAGRAL